MKNTAKKSAKNKDLTEYSVKEVVSKIKEKSKEKFDASVEIHVTLNTDPKKQDHQIRYSLSLPHGTGKTKKVAVFASKKIPGADLNLSENDIDKIESGNLKPKVDFDIIISEPKYMSKIAKVAKILGPAGMMPNPKNGTVTDEIEKAVDLVKKGKIDVKVEKGASVIHNIIGKVSFDNKQLEENLVEFVKTLKQNKPAKLKSDLIKSITICSSMGPSFRLNHSEIG